AVAAHRLVVAEHSPAARPARLVNERKRLRRQQRLSVAPRVVGVRVRDERERPHDQGVKPEPVARQRDAAIPDDVARHEGALTPIAARASWGMPMSAIEMLPDTRGPSAVSSPALGSVKVTVTSARTQGE